MYTKQEKNLNSLRYHHIKVGVILSTLKQTKEEFIFLFRKKNGKKRLIRCRFGVRHNIKGGTNHTQQNHFPYQTVWDLDKKAYRTINMDTAKSIIRKGGREYIFKS